MNESDLERFAGFAGRLTDVSGATIREAARRPFRTESKDDGSPVTAVDQAVEDRIRAMIADAYPDHGIVGEERDDPCEPHGCRRSRTGP